MSVFYNPRTKQPQIWVYPIFILLTLGVFYLIYSYGERKSRDRIRVEENSQPERTY